MKSIRLVADKLCSASHGMMLSLRLWKMTAQSKTKLAQHHYQAAIEFGTVYRAWEQDTYNQAPYIVWGWTAAVAKKSKNHEMAFDYLCFFANDANHQADIAIGRFGVNPFKKSDFKA
jgi:ABC-type glycerol-3-phosphate transport system substrate-binding protein